MELFDTSNYEIVSENGAVSNDLHKDYCTDITSSNLPESLQEIEMQIDRLRQRWGEFTYLIGQRLKYINDNGLYETNNYPNFKTYINIALKMSENNAYYYIAVYEYFTEEQTRLAGSKLKLIIPILNKLKRDKSIPADFRETRLKSVRDDLFYKVCNKTYRDAEKTVSDIRRKYYPEMPKILTFDKIAERGSKIVIDEDDPEIRKELIGLIKGFYGIE